MDTLSAPCSWSTPSYDIRYEIVYIMAVGARVELTMEESKSSVLPLHHPTMFGWHILIKHTNHERKFIMKKSFSWLQIVVTLHVSPTHEDGEITFSPICYIVAHLKKYEKQSIKGIFGKSINNIRRIGVPPKGWLIFLCLSVYIIYYTYNAHIRQALFKNFSNFFKALICRYIHLYRILVKSDKALCDIVTP